MALPDITVTFYADFPYAPSYFTLGDPVRGELDNTTYRLYSATPVNLADETNVVTIRRGSSSQLFADTPAGTVTLQLNNEDRRFDPTNASSDLFGNILPGRRFTIAADGITIFDGRSEDWDLNYEVGGRSVAIVSLVDGLAVLGRQQFDDWTPTGGQTGGPRLSAVLDRPEVQWPAARALDTGVSTLSDAPVSFGDNVLNYCNTVAKSDVGTFYAARDGVLTFRDRHANLNATAAVEFADDGSGIAYAGVEVVYGSELLFNRIGVQADGVASVTVLELGSQLLYGIRSYTTPTLLIDSSDQALNLGNYLAGIYSEPELRFGKLVLTIHAMSAAERAQVLALDLTSVVRVKFTPNNTGTQIDRHCIVLGIDHDISAMVGTHTMTLTLGDTDRRSMFVLDDPVFGVLDTSVLAF